MQIATAAQLLLVEDHPLYRDGLMHMLARCAPQLRCREARDAATALDILRRSDTIDLVLADQRLPGAMDGMALLAQIGVERPTTGRVLLSGQDDPRLPREARRQGLMGYLPKSLEPDRWIEALQRILAGEPWFPNDAAGLQGLTSRQALILAKVAAGQSNKTIARDIGITERTVKFHLAEVYARLGAAGRAEAVAQAAARGWIALGAAGP